VRCVGLLCSAPIATARKGVVTKADQHRVAIGAAVVVMTFKPKKIETLADLQAMVPGTAFEAMGVVIEEVDDEQISITMPVTSRIRQPMGIVHGGMTMFLMESAASIHACWQVDLGKRVPVGTEINGTHLNPATDGTLRAVGRVVRRSRSFITHQIDVYHVESARLISTGRMTSFYVRTGLESAGG
jgi:1,4-dihydroxy-2-naphthoyl-CoA hydrolase